jgi:hypothetical protein
LFGISKLTLREVIEQYKATLDSSTWQVNRIDAGGASFTSHGSIYLGVSDNYRWLPSMQEAAERGETKFATLFLVELTTFVDSSMSVDKCT